MGSIFKGWMNYNGNEIINSARTAAYLKNAGVRWFVDCHECPDLVDELDDDKYTDPVTDKAPWYDPDDPFTWKFWGYYPLAMTGTDDSTRQAAVIQSTGDGGIVSQLRFSTRDMVFTGMVFGADDAALEAGMSWLRYSLITAACETDLGCFGEDMCLMNACPTEEGVAADADYLRTFRRVTIVDGPKVLAEYKFSDGAVAYQVEFTATAGVPWSYGSPIPVITVGDDGGSWPDPSPVSGEPTCTSEAPPILDPTCPVLPSAPSVPAVPLSCFTLPSDWDRYPLTISPTAVRQWQDTVPVIEVRSAVPLQNVRLRFYADPFGRGLTQPVDDCSWCGEFYITYVPPDVYLVLDGSDETITAHSTGSNGLEIIQNASSLVQSTDGGPFEWPILTCGYGYVMHVDLPQGSDLPDSLNVSLVNRGI